MDLLLSDGTWTVPAWLAALTPIDRDRGEFGDFSLADAQRLETLLRLHKDSRDRPESPEAAGQLVSLVRLAHMLGLGDTPAIRVRTEALESFSLEIVRQSGLTNMFDVNAVQVYCLELSRMFPDVVIVPASVSRTAELLMKVAEGRGGGWGSALDHADPADPLASWIAGGTRSAEMLSEPLRSLYK